MSAATSIERVARTRKPPIGGPTPFFGYQGKQAEQFAAAWLPAWTGDDPQRLAFFYTHDTFYGDPQVPGGIRGRERSRPTSPDCSHGIQTGSGRAREYPSERFDVIGTELA